MKQSENNRMSRATIWGWGDDFETVKTNSQKYISKRWKGTTKECAIGVTAIERYEGTSFDIAAYTSNPQKVGELAKRLFDIAIGLEGDVKVDFVMIVLSRDVVSEKELYRDSLRHVEEEYSRCDKALIAKVGADPKMKAKVQGKKIVVIPQITLTCELDSDHANKVIVDATDSDFTRLRNFIHSVNKGLIKEGLAKSIVGFKLYEDVEKLKIYDINIEGDEVYVWLV